MRRKFTIKRITKDYFKKIVPSGFETRQKPHRFNERIDLTELYCYKEINPLYAEKSLGTLGGGNHFIEANKDDDGRIYIVIPSGSRHLGLEVANYYQEEAYKRLNGSSKHDIDELIKKMKAEGKEKQIQTEITKLKNTKFTDVPKHLAYCEGEVFEQYMDDIVNNIGDTVEINKVIKPIYNFKAGEE